MHWKPRKLCDSLCCDIHYSMEVWNWSSIPPRCDCIYLLDRWVNGLEAEYLSICLPVSQTFSWCHGKNKKDLFLLCCVYRPCVNLTPCIPPQVLLILPMRNLYSNFFFPSRHISLIVGCFFNHVLSAFSSSSRLPNWFYLNEILLDGGDHVITTLPSPLLWE